MDPSEKFLVSSRFWVQRVLVPILVLIGAGGNIVTVMVLTRRRMRCSTNIYLTALAVADLVYLLFVLVLSFEHYPNIHDIRHELYWRFYGINHWLADAASSTSIWLVVCFTIERYIAICHPIRGKVLCTENRAKRVIAAVSILCIFATISTSFEYQLTTRVQCEQKECLKPSHLIHENASDIFDNITGEKEAELKEENGELISDNKQYYLDNCVNDTGQLCSSSSKECQLLNEQLISTCLNGTYFNDTSDDDCCVKRTEIIVESTNLGKNETYKTIFYWFTSIMFTFMPLVLIGTFNCFLVNIVRKSQKQRKELTMSQENNTQSQENRMTLILIAVVILFLICQTPTAFILIYTSVYPNFEDAFTVNIVKGLGNIFNLLVSINAACNFLLYCALSDKYRRTFKALFCGRSKSINRYDNSFSGMSRYSQRTLSRSNTMQTQRNGFNRNVSVYVPKNYETQCLNSIPRAKTVIVRPTDVKRSNGRLV